MKTNNLPTVKADLNKSLLNEYFWFLWIVKARYIFMFGSKEGGKSKAAALKTVTKFIAEQDGHALVLRKHANWNITSTFEDILWAFEKLAEDFDIPQLVPVSAEESRKKPNARFVYKTTPQAEIKDKLTGTKIFFTGLDRLAAGGITLSHNPSHAITTIWYEEKVDVDPGEKELLDDSSMIKWKIAESTLFRGWRDSKIDPDTGEEVSFIKEGFEWVNPLVLMTGNSHNEEDWAMQMLDSLIPFNPHNQDDVDRMEREKVFLYYDPKYQGGDGLLLARTSVLLNPGRDFNFIQQLKEENSELYNYLFLGATQALGKLAYDGEFYLLDTSHIDINKVWPLSFGIDYASSAKHDDWFAGVFLGTPFITPPDNPFGEPTFNKKMYFGEFAWHPSTMGFKDDYELSENVFNHLISHINTCPEWKGRISMFGFAITVDNSAQSFINTLRSTLISLRQERPDEGWLAKINIVPVEGKNAMIKLEGEMLKLNARKGRVELNKRFLAAEMEHVDRTTAPLTFKQFKLTALDEKGEVIDKYRDFVDAKDYTWMVEPLKGLFERKRQMRYRQRLPKIDDINTYK